MHKRRRSNSLPYARPRTVRADCTTATERASHTASMDTTPLHVSPLHVSRHPRLDQQLAARRVGNLIDSAGVRAAAYSEH